MQSDELKQIVSDYFQATSSFTQSDVQAALARSFSDSAEFKIAHPFGSFSGPGTFYQHCLAPLFKAMPDLERRNMIASFGWSSPKI